MLTRFFKNIKIILLFIYPFLAKVHGQRLNIALGVFLDSPAKIESQYNINDRMALGLFYKLGYQSLSPTYIGVSFKRNMNNQDVIYYGCNLGLQYIRNSEFSVLENPTTSIGGCVLFGAQRFGIWRRISFYSEAQLGYLPNNLFSILWKSYQAIPNPLTGQAIIKDYTSFYTWWNISMGIRFHLGKQNF
jgi:hypothetical protein